jgi:hypothetical protein
VLGKEDKVLVVDTSGLPAEFGSPSRPRAEIGTGVGITVLGCWTGAWGLLGATQSDWVDLRG